MGVGLNDFETTREELTTKPMALVSDTQLNLRSINRLLTFEFVRADSIDDAIGLICLVTTIATSELFVMAAVVAVSIA